MAQKLQPPETPHVSFWIQCTVDLSPVLFVVVLLNCHWLSAVSQSNAGRSVT